MFNLCIQVPRAKYIGYSRIFREFSGNTVDHPQRDNTAADTDKESGPWSFGRIDSFMTPGASASVITVSGAYDNSGSFANSVYVNSDTFPALDSVASIGGNSGNAAQYSPLISGRNECAVKFVRLGIPSNLWIRMSVLNTDGTVDPLTNDGVWTV